MPTIKITIGKLKDNDMCVFTVGCKVKITEDVDKMFKSFGSSRSFVKGKEYVVDVVDTNDSTLRLKIDSTCNWVRMKHVELVAAKETNEQMFSEGDSVEVTASKEDLDGYYCNTNIKTGNVYKVHSTSTTLSGERIYLLVLDSGFYGDTWVKAAFIEPVKPVKPKAPRKIYRQYDRTLKLAVTMEYLALPVNKGQRRGATKIAKKYGVPERNIYAWVSQYRIHQFSTDHAVAFSHKPELTVKKGVSNV